MIKGATKDHFSLYSRNGLINELLKENGELVREAAVKLETNLNGNEAGFYFPDVPSTWFAHVPSGLTLLGIPSCS
jgi:hypothetical protein